MEEKKKINVGNFEVTVDTSKEAKERVFETVLKFYEKSPGLVTIQNFYISGPQILSGISLEVEKDSKIK